MRHFTPRRPWAPLTDPEWAALAPFVAKSETAPGPKLDQRQRFDAILHNAVSGDPWRAVPPAYGRGETVGKHFRRLTEAGLWQRILTALAAPNCPPALRAIEYWLCRAARRAMRLLKMSGLDLAQKLGFLTALPMLPWFLPDRHLSEQAWAWTRALVADLSAGGWADRKELRDLQLLHRLAGGRAVWSKRFAPP